MVNWIRRAKKENISRYFCGVELFHSIVTPTAAGSGLGSTSPFLRLWLSVAVPPAWVHLAGKASADNTPSRSASENSWQPDSYVPVLMDPTKVRALIPGSISGEQCTVGPFVPQQALSPFCICATRALGSFAPDALLLSISSDSGK